MSATPLVYPMAAMVLLTMVVLVRMFRARVGAVRSGQIDVSYYRLFQGADEPELNQKLSRNFVSLFEAPTVFYVVCLAAMAAGVGSIAMVVLAWAYVASRVAHSVIHLGANRLRHRMRTYCLGWLVLLAMWSHLVISTALRG